MNISEQESYQGMAHRVISNFRRYRMANQYLINHANIPEKMESPELYMVTYKVNHRPRTKDLWLQCDTPGDRVYEAYYILHELGIDARRVQVAEGLLI